MLVKFKISKHNLGKYAQSMATTKIWKIIFNLNSHDLLSIILMLNLVLPLYIPRDRIKDVGSHDQSAL